MYKVIHNNLIIDLIKEPRYVRYLQKTKRFIGTDRLAATGIMSSDGEEFYQLMDRPRLSPEKLRVVQLVEISEEEFNKLSSQKIKTREVNSDANIKLQNQIDNLTQIVEQLAQQNKILLEQLGRVK